MMNVALIRVLGQDRLEANTADHNIGLLYLANVVRQSGSIPIILDPYDPDSEYKKSGDPLFSNNFDIACFTTHYLNIEITLEISSRIKSKNPNCLIIFGGHQASGAAKELLTDHKFIDVVSVGEGESTLAEIIRELGKGITIKEIRNKGIYLPNKYVNLYSLEIPKRIGKYPIARIATSRGCPYICTFCTTPAIRKISNEPLYRESTPKQVVDEMEQLIYENNTNKIYINDDIYVFDEPKSRNRAIEIAEEIIRRNLKISYKAQLRVDSFKSQHESILNLLKKSGLREVFLGLESGSDITLKRYKKKTSVKTNICAIKLYNAVGIKVNAGNIVASPDSKISEIYDSILNFQKMGLAYLFFRRINFRAIPFPGTELERNLEIQGRLENKPRYLPRQYSFLDTKVGDIVSLIEMHMPEFLNVVGSSAFNLKNKAILKKYNYDSLSQANNIQKVLYEWNNLSSSYLLKWFMEDKSLKEKSISIEMDFEEYTDRVINIRDELIKQINSSETNAFDTDSF